MAPTGSGTKLCNDAGLSGVCGNTDADYVGPYKLNMKCDSGFYDPIYGGTCWKCPDNDSNGNPWLRNSTHVESDDACWRVPYEKLSKASFVKKGSAWDCGSGQFWDQHDTAGSWIVWGGACWQCPDAYPRRTAYIVSGDKACATPVRETAHAQLLNYNSCPKPDPASMYSNKPPVISGCRAIRFSTSHPGSRWPIMPAGPASLVPWWTVTATFWLPPETRIP